MPSCSPERQMRLAIVLAFLIVAAGLPIGPPLKSALNKEGDPFLDWPSHYDVVVVGDSRVREGVDVTVVCSLLPDRTVAKLAFSGLGYDADFLEMARGRLSEGTSAPALVMGVTPRSMTTNAVKENAYRELLTAPVHVRELNHLIEARFYRAESALQPLNPLAIRVWLASLRTGRRDAPNTVRSPRHRQVFGPARSAEEVGYSDLRDEKTVEDYRRQFRESKVDPTVQRRVLEEIRRLTARGTKVFGFRPPVSVKMRAMEDSESGFDEAAFVVAFERSGGRWLSIPDKDYRTTDGSHLDRESAARFSQALAMALRGEFARNNRPYKEPQGVKSTRNAL